MGTYALPSKSRRVLAALALALLFAALALGGAAAPAARAADTRVVAQTNQAGRLDTVSLYDLGRHTAGLYTFVASGTKCTKTLFWKSAKGTFAAARAKLAAGDVNGDGYTDAVVLYDLGGGKSALYLFLSDGTKFTKSKAWQSTPATFVWSKSKLAVGDTNGDGKDDVQVLYDQGSKTAALYLFLSDGAAFTQSLAWQSPAGKLDWAHAQVGAGDVNADGKDDVLMLAGAGQHARLLALTSDGAHYTETVLWQGAFSAARATFAVGDLNSDGKADGVALYDLGKHKAALYGFVSSGAGWKKAQLWKSAKGGLDCKTARLAAGDLTGDGKADALVLSRVNAKKSRLTTYVSKGSTCTPKVSWAGALRCDRARLTCALSSPVVIPDTTERLGEASVAALTDVSPDGITYTFSHATADLNALAPGDVIVALPSAAVPDGIFRKVVTVSPDHTVLTTEQATVEDAFDSAQVSFTHTITPADLTRQIKAVPGVTVVRSPMTRLGGPITFKIDDVDIGGVKLDGELKVSMKFDFDFSVGLFSGLESLNLSATTNTQSTLTAKVEGTLDKEYTDELISWMLPTFAIAVGPVPVWFTPELAIEVGVDGQVTAGVKSSVTLNTSTTLGVKYDGHFHPVYSQNSTHSFVPPHLYGTAELKAFAGPKLALFVYSVAGPYVALEGYLGLFADTDEVPWWQLKAGLDGRFGAELEVFGEELANWSVEKNIVEWVLAQADVPYTPQGAVGGRVLDADTKDGIAGAAVKLRAGADVTSGPVVASTTSAADGAYSTDSVPTGIYTASAEAKGYGIGYRTVTVVENTITSGQDIELPPVHASAPFAICQQVHTQDLPAVSNDTVVWADYRNGHDDNIYGKDLTTDQELPIATTSDFETEPDISGDVVVYVRVQNAKSHVWGKNLTTGDSFPIWTAAGNHSDPKISGNRVVWWDYSQGNGDINGKNIHTGAEYSIADDDHAEYAPAISGNLVVWVQESGNGPDTIMGKYLSGGASFVIRSVSSGQMVANPDVSGNVVVWDESVSDSGSGHYVTKGKGLPDGPIFVINDGGPGSDPGQPAIDGPLVVWEDYRNGPQVDIYGKNIDTGVEFPVCTDPSQQHWPAISGGLIVWEDNRTDVADIWGCRLE